MAAGRAYGREGRRALKGMIVLSVISVLPDIDVAGFSFGVPYEAPWGHRGATHSLTMALILGCAAFLASRALKLPPLKSALFVTAVAASHGLLDTLTVGGGLGCELLWPFSPRRFWGPWRFIPVAPIGQDMFSARGAIVVAAELVLFAPFWIYATFPRRRRASQDGSVH